MTVSELYRSTAQLGFEETLEDAARFVYSANRALLQINALRPETAHITINHHPPANLLEDAGYEPVDVITEYIAKAEGARSYYFEADGTGMVYIEALVDGGAWETLLVVKLTGTGLYRPYRGHILRDGAPVAGEVRLRFAGEYLFSVRHIAFYAHLRSGEVADIPAYEPFVRYDISALTDDFLGLASPPVREGDGHSYLVSGYHVDNERVLLLPRETEGVYKVVYYHRPEELQNSGEPEGDDTEIDLDEELCALMPLLIAALIWADDEPEKAQYYMSIYENRAALLEKQAKDRVGASAPVTVRDVYGW